MVGYLRYVAYLTACVTISNMNTLYEIVLLLVVVRFAYNLYKQNWKEVKDTLRWVGLGACLAITIEVVKHLFL
jgi:hypothetical protein